MIRWFDGRDKDLGTEQFIAGITQVNMPPVFIPRNKPPLQHVWHKCKNPECQCCEGGLGWCIVCDAFEGSLLTYCPGFKLNQDTIDACYHGNVKDLCYMRAMVEHGARIVNGELVWNRG